MSTPAPGTSMQNRSRRRAVDVLLLACVVAVGGCAYGPKTTSKEFFQLAEDSAANTNGCTACQTDLVDLLRRTINQIDKVSRHNFRRQWKR